MVQIVPFAGSVVKQDFVRRVPAPAFDAMSGMERAEYLRTHPESYTLVTRSPGDGGPNDTADTQQLIDMGGAALERIIDSGAFAQVSQQSLFLYRLRFGDHEQVGIVGLVEVQGYLDGTVKRHERVNTGRAAHLSRHFEQLGAQSSPIALGYRASSSVSALICRLVEAPPHIEFTSGDGLEQAVWVVDDVSAIDTIQRAIAKRELYILDGHHRAAAAGQLRERSEPGQSADWMLGVLFADDIINIEPFHRRVRLPLGQASAVHDSLVDVLGLVPDPDDGAELPPSADHVGVYSQGQWWIGALPEPTERDSVSQIAPVRLQRDVVGPVFGIDPSDPGDRIGYFLERADRSKLGTEVDGQEVLFLLQAVTAEEIFAVADEGLDMPPKSTFVVPKPRSGVFLRRL